MKNRSIVLVIVLAAAMGVVCWQVLYPHEISYKGKALGYWMDPSARGGQETTAERSDALAAMSEKAVPYLVERLHWKPSPTMQKLCERFPKFPPFISYVQGGWDPRGQAAHFLGELGPLATNAIPELMVASTTSDLPSSWGQRLCARAALIKIKQEPLAPYIEKLKDTSLSSSSSLDDWYQNAMMIGEFGTNASAAVPNLILALGPTNHPVIQAHALLALGEIHSQPGKAVPAIVPFLKSPSVGLRQKSVFALAAFREAAKPAWTNLVQCLGDADPWTRHDAARALKAIDPARALKAGVK